MKKIKVTLIGPMQPFRGGIAQYNTYLFEALSKIHDTQAISFNRMYPSWLYPGKSEKDAQHTKALDRVEYKIDAYSPLSLEKTINSILKHKSDVVIINWWTLFWQPGLSYVAKRLRQKNIKVIFLCHNISDHDASFVRKRLSRALLRQADGYIVHSTDQTRVLKRQFKKPVLNKKILPLYDHYPAKKQTNSTETKALKLLFFGFIRPYKGLDLLLDAFEEIKNKNIELQIVGEVWNELSALEKRIREIGNSRISYNFSYVNDDEAADYFLDSDVIVLPYRSAPGSAVVSLAYRYGKPVIATQVGGLKDAVIDGKTGWLIKPNSPSILAEKIEEISKKQAKSMSLNIVKLNKENTWQKFAKEISSFIKKV